MSRSPSGYPAQKPLVPVSPKVRSSSAGDFQYAASPSEFTSDAEEIRPVHALRLQIPRAIGPYELRGTVGEGEFSIVKLAYNGSTGCYYACKVLERSRLKERDLEHRFESEIRVHQRLRHPSIVQLIDLLQDSNFYFVFIEFCPGGELFQFIVDRDGLTESQARPILRRILEAVAYVHSLGISHRDLKPENILLDRFGNAKLSDFGLAGFVNEDGLVATPCGSPCYASPECLSGQPYNGRTTDCWSVGVIAYAMLTGGLPWTKRNQHQLFAQIRKGEYTIPERLSPECRSFIASLMCVDPDLRATASMALQHDFFAAFPSALLVTENVPDIVVTPEQVDDFFRSSTLAKVQLPGPDLHQ
jgi:serine/threonine protein kinase